MGNWIVSLAPGERAVFRIRGQGVEPRLADAALDVANEGGRLAIADLGGAVSAVRGRGMAALAAGPRSRRADRAVRAETMAPGDTVQLAVPERLYRSCIYVEAWEDGFILTGGADLVERIEGERIEDRIERDPDDLADGPIAFRSPRAVEAARRIRRRKSS